MASVSLPSVQSLLIETGVGAQRMGSGTAFVCHAKSGPVLITNRHNVTGRHQGTNQPLSPTGAVPDVLNVLHNRLNKFGEWVARLEPLYTNGKPRWKEHPTLGPKSDVVGLPLTTISDVAFYPYDPTGGPAIAINPAEPVSVVGFPFGIQAGGSLAVWATGFVASEPDIDFDGLPIFLVDCRTRPGQSGSAVIAHRNGGSVNMADGSMAIMSGPVTKFLGVYSGRLNDQSDLGIVWKSTIVADILASM